MKQTHFFFYLLLLWTAMVLTSCGEDNPDVPDAGITGQSWSEGTPLNITLDGPLTITFTAAAEWKASTPVSWCTIAPASGSAGKNTLKVQVTSATQNERTATITLNVSGYSPATFQVTQQKDSGEVSEDMEVNAKVDEYLKEMYLWNEEYKTLALDFTKDYESFFYDALGSMTTNTLDKKPYTGSDGRQYYSLFSYIEKLNPVTETRTTKLVDKELAYSFGITGLYPIQFLNASGTGGVLYFVVQGVYPDSPAEAAGIRRGSMIRYINRESLSVDNYEAYYYDLLSPASGISLHIGAEHKESNELLEADVTARAMYCNPVIYNQVEEFAGHKIGYLVYAGFDAGFDGELFEVFKLFKASAIDDLVLDLRYNGGGHVISANLMASCIAGASSSGKLFNEVRYNEERMKSTSEASRREQFAYSRYDNLGTSLSAGGLGMKRVYCLTGNNTASASELVINSLRGIDVEVILIGEATLGKNVGMEYTDMEIGKNTYRVVPITFQSYNAKGFGDYEKGFAPDVALVETENPLYPDAFYVYRPYGSHEELLYAKALEQITGKNPMPETRNAGSEFLKGRKLKAPAIYRPGRDGMLMKYKAAE